MGLASVLCRVVCFMILSIVPCYAQSAWTPVVSTDRLTGKKETTYVSRSASQFTQFGRPVTAELRLFCVEGPNLQAAFVFSERVGYVSDVMMRVRFDEGPVYQDLEEFRNRYGRTLVLYKGAVEGHMDRDAYLLPLLLRSQRLRVEFRGLPWAGSPLMEFKTSGVAEAASRLGCS